MFRSNFALTAAILTFALCGCQSSSNAQAGMDGPTSSPSTVAPFRPDPCSIYGRGQADPLSCLRQACAQTSGAKFDEASAECVCDMAGPAFRNFSTHTGQGSCDRVEPDTSCSKQKGGFAGVLKRDDSDVSRFVSDCFTSIAFATNTILGLELLTDGLSPSETQAAAARLAQWADSRKGNFAARLWSTTGLENVILNVGPGRLPREVVRNILTPPKADIGTQRTAVSQATRHYYERDLALLDAALGAPGPGFVAPELGPVPTTADSAELLRALARGYKQARSSAFEATSSEVRRKNGCSGACTLTRELPGPADLRVQQTKSYVSGLAYRNAIVARARDGRASALLALNLGGFPMLAITTRLVREPGGRIKTVVVAYDREWKVIGGPYELEILKNVNDALDRAATLASDAALKSGPALVACEDRVELDNFDRAGVAGNLFVGPYFSRATDLSGSVFGWFENSSRDLPTYFDGLVGIRANGLASDAAIYKFHPAMVYRTIVRSELSARIAPIDSSSCFDRYEQWKTAARSRGIKVINMSGGWQVDPEACAHGVWGQVLADGERPFLWILAAGNSGEDGDKGPSNACPPNAARAQPNAIVVAALDRDHLWTDSNFGVQLADIAADGDAEPLAEGSGETKGTSFAAPRVAAVAAAMAARHPELSVEDLRRAILWGAIIPEGTNFWGDTVLQPLPVRSGGYLDKDLALQISDELAAGNRDPAQVLGKVFCEVGTNCEYARLKAEWLRKPEVNLWN